MLQAPAREVGGRIAPDDQRRIALLPGENIHRRRLARVVKGDPPRVVDTEGVAGHPGVHFVGPIDVVMASHRRYGELRVPAQLRCKFDGIPDVLVLPRGHRETEPEVDRTELRILAEVHHPEELLAGDARDRPRDRLRLPPDDGPERREDRVVPAGFDLHELVGDVRGLGLPDIDDDHLPVAEGVLKEEPFRIARVPGEVAGVGVDRV
ncbi:MAG: hypothetical protein BWX50_01222 [Euryarchaeota archaeon ADurb.Bin009]|nr:MAG: hypothetical protein BWX50_01222 [Euryarchaeota archaeon ADurb.Bin009]